MPTPVAVLSGGTRGFELGMFKKGPIAQGFNFPLNTNYTWWNGVDILSTQYLIYTDKYTMGSSTLANTIPVAWSTPDLNDSSLLALINTLPPRVGLPGFTDLDAALNWMDGTGDFFLLKNGIENIVTTNLQLYYDAGLFTSYAGTGVSVSDLSGNNRTGTLTNGISFLSSGVASFELDGTDDYITSSLATNANNNVTLEAWFNSDNVNQEGQMIIYNGSDNSGNGYGFAVNKEAITTGNVYALYGALSWFNTGFTLKTGVWYHGVMTISGTSLKLYINGSLIYSVSSSNPNTPSLYTNIGRNDFPAARYFNGKIPIARVYTIALSADQVLQNYNAQKGRFGLPSPVTDGLVARLEAGNPASYPGSGTIWYDISGNGNNFTLFNGASYDSSTKSMTFDGSDDYGRSTNFIDLTSATATTVQWLGKIDVSGSQFLWEHTPNWNTISGGFGIILDSNGSAYLQNSWHANWRNQAARNFLNSTQTSYQFFLQTHRLIPNNSLGLQDWVNTDLQTFSDVNNYPTGTSTVGNTNGFANDYTYLASRAGTGALLNGNIGVFLMYRRALSQPEIVQNYEYYREIYGLSGATRNGLVFSYDAGNAQSYNGVGPSWYDLSGNMNDSTLINGPTYVTDGGGSFSFDGVDDYIDTNNTFSSLLNSSLPISFETWVYVNLNNNDEMFIGSSWSEGGVNFRKTGSSFTANKVRFLLFTNGSNGGGLDSPVLISSGWYHLVGTYNGGGLASSSNFKLYVNGVEVGVSAQFGTPTSIPVVNKILLGQNGQSGSNGFFTGKMGRASIYNRVLSSSEVSQNFNASMNRYGWPDAKTILEYYPSAPNGLYMISPPGAQSPQLIYCDMTSGGWMLVSSNDARSTTIPGGTGRNNVNYILSRSTPLGSPDPNSDYIIGSIIDNMTFTQVRIFAWGYQSTNGTYSFPNNLGTYITATWSLTTTGSSRFTEKVTRANVTFGGNSTVAPAAQYFVLDAVRNDIGYDANVNQSTIGAAGVASSTGDPSEGCYLGHGITEGSYEGWYNTNSTVYDTQGYTTWVR